MTTKFDAKVRFSGLHDLTETELNGYADDLAAATAFEARAELELLAQRELHMTRNMYLEGIQGPVQVAPSVYRISMAEGLPDMVEAGAPAYDLFSSSDVGKTYPIYLGVVPPMDSRAQRTASGLPFLKLSYPTESGKSRQFKRQEVNILQQVSANKRPTAARGQYSRDQITQLVGKYRAAGYSKADFSRKAPAAARKLDPSQRSGFVIFRRVPQNGVQHPGFDGVHFFSRVEERMPNIMLRVKRKT